MPRPPTGVNINNLMEFLPIFSCDFGRVFLLGSTFFSLKLLQFTNRKLLQLLLVEIRGFHFLNWTFKIYGQSAMLTAIQTNFTFMQDPHYHRCCIKCVVLFVCKDCATHLLILQISTPQSYPECLFTFLFPFCTQGVQGGPNQHKVKDPELVRQNN